MINKHNFRLRENGEPNYKCYCRSPELIENYDKAIADTTQTWDVHHRLECCFTQKFMKEMNLYYDVEPEALIFLTKEEHRKIDSANKRISESLKGMKFSEEHKRKIGKANSKRVLCVEIDEVFESISDAHRKTGINQGNISMACNGKYNKAGGYHWRYV